MAPPGLFGNKKAVEPKDKHAHKAARKKPNKVVKQTTDPAPKKGFPLSRLPAEVQHMIWAEAIQKPACHTFKVYRSRDTDGPPPWKLHLHPIPPRHDQSAYRRWKSFLHSTQGDDKKLKNISFQAGFRSAMMKFQPLHLRIAGKYQLAAAIDVDTDLVILEFERGPTAPPIGWFQHSDDQVMNMASIRRRMQHFKRVAIHYKSHHQAAPRDGPFSCFCPPVPDRGCARSKACYYELACFLDCFKELEEFYLVVETKGKQETEWAGEYRKRVREKKYRVAKPERYGGGTFELSHFFSAKKEYIQHCPPAFSGDLANKVGESPIMRAFGPRECLLNAMKVYRGQILNEVFQNEQARRDKVKFGLLLEYPLEDK